MSESRMQGTTLWRPHKIEGQKEVKFHNQMRATPTQPGIQQFIEQPFLAHLLIIALCGK